MKTNKLLAAGALALSMAMSPVASMLTAMPVMAETVTTGSITVKADDTHTYNVYQIFTGDLNGTTLSNLKWGKNGKGTEGETVSDSVIAEILGATGTDKEKLATITKYVDTTTPFDTVSKDKPLNNIAAGYYLITESGAVEGNDASTLFLAKIVGPVEITPKKGVPTVEKKVKDTNDTTGETSGWQDSADHDFGDEIDFMVTGTLPNNYDAYKTYTMIFHDKYYASAFNFVENSLHVYVGTSEADKVEVTSGFVADSASDGTLTVTINDVKTAIPTAKAGSKIFVTYKLELENYADLGFTKNNDNTVYLEFSNNPNVGGEGETGTTPVDTVRVFTYQVTVNKKDNEGKDLEGAGFTLYKKNDQGEYVKVGDEIKPAQGAQFEFKGLDDGDYKLEETTVPTGYSKAADIEFTITATHEVESTDPELTEITINKTEFDVDENTGEISTNVVNTREGTLPETGGMGTTMIYGAGALMAVGAAVVYVTNKRTRKD